MIFDSRQRVNHVDEACPTTLVEANDGHLTQVQVCLNGVSIPKVVLIVVLTSALDTKSTRQ